MAYFHRRKYLSEAKSRVCERMTSSYGNGTPLPYYKRDYAGVDIIPCFAKVWKTSIFTD